MRTPRGLTLVEVLAACVLLAVMAAVCAPLLRQALRALDGAPPPCTARELAEIAATISPDGDGGDGGQEGEIAWPDDPERPPITVRVFKPEDPEAVHVWLALSCGGLTVFRWVVP